MILKFRIINLFLSLKTINFTIILEHFLMLNFEENVL